MTTVPITVTLSCDRTPADPDAFVSDLARRVAAGPFVQGARVLGYSFGRQGGPAQLAVDVGPRRELRDPVQLLAQLAAWLAGPAGLGAGSGVRVAPEEIALA